MKMKLTLFALVMCFFQESIAQSNPLSTFDNLVGSTWVSEGKQLGGHNGKTVKEFSLGLDGKIVKVITYTTDPKTLEFGLRNEGIRIFRNEIKQIEFYEFDKLGGVSKGIVITQGRDLHYEYLYGDLLLRDSWIFISNDQYQFKVCSLKEGECDKVYHTSIFNRKKEKSSK